MIAITHVLMWMVHTLAVAEKDMFYMLMNETVQILMSALMLMVVVSKCVAISLAHTLVVVTMALC